MKGRRNQKTRGVALASAGLALALLVLVVLKLTGITELLWREWLLLAGVTALIQTGLFLIPALGIDARFDKDPRFIHTPTLTAAFLLNAYLVFAPEGRVLALMAWLIALLFLAGLAGFVEVTLLSLAMGAAYALVMGLHYLRGEPMVPAYEITVFGAFLALTVYAGFVFERLRRDRLETQRLKRELMELASTDELTGLPNRREFEARLDQELKRLRRYGGTGTVAILDVDNFKVFNDTHGHLQGDQVLKGLASLMRERLRTTDVVARYGGEEFTLLMVNTPNDVALQALDRLRAIIEAYPFRGESVLPGGHLTVSCGLASFPEEGETAAALLAHADRALYRAKNGGRNRVEAAA